MTIGEGSRLKKIGNQCFLGSGVEEIALPHTLREIGDHALGYNSLKTIYVEDGCEVSPANTGVPYGASVISLSAALVGGVCI